MFAHGGLCAQRARQRTRGRAFDDVAHHGGSRSGAARAVAVISGLAHEIAFYAYAVEHAAYGIKQVFAPDRA